MSPRPWHLVVPALVGAAVWANLPGDPCDQDGGSALALASCAMGVEHDGTFYEPWLLERRVPARLVAGRVDAVLPGCDDVGTNGCGPVDDEPDTPTEVRRIRGFGDQVLAWPGSPDRRPLVLVPVVDGAPRYVMGRRVERFVNRLAARPVDRDAITRP